MEAEPKSASFTCPGSVSKTFPALISLSNTWEEMITARRRESAWGQERSVHGMLLKRLKHSPVNHVVGVKISQPLKRTMRNCSYFNFLQRFLVNCRCIIGDVNQGGEKKPCKCRNVISSKDSTHLLTNPRQSLDNTPSPAARKPKQLWVDLSLSIHISLTLESSSMTRYCRTSPRQCVLVGNILCTLCCLGVVFSAGISLPWLCLAISETTVKQQ